MEPVALTLGLDDLAAMRQPEITTRLELTDNGEVPTPLVAVTKKASLAPGTSPEIVHDSEGEHRIAGGALME